MGVYLLDKANMPKSHIMNKNKFNKTSVSLFSGAGGMDVGFSKAGFRCLWANDMDKDACETFRINHGDIIHQGDIDELMQELDDFSNVDCVFGGPPCQGFSVAGKMDVDDPRSKLVWSYMSVVEKLKPKSFVMENVKALGTLSKFADFREGLIKKAIQLGYRCELLLLNAKDFGIPQNRQRMFLIGFKEEFGPINIGKVIESHHMQSPTVREALIHLGKAGTEGNSRVCNARITNAAKPVMRKSPYAGMMFNGQGRPLNPDGYASTIAASMGGNRTPIIDEGHLFDGKESYVEEYHAHLMAGGEPKSMHDVSSSLRRLTIDEAIILQTFPTDYEFFGKQSSMWRQIGNAVPCKLAEAVALSVMDVLEGRVSVNEDIQVEVMENYAFAI
ncbi:DNA cytosine methyltransferase [Pseudoalteromonas xiamenensis]|uniref:Cytosine-specific methyltransferase n=1 Tax=Pseudoalteromonas xiamenensis TaxID=882626 RepID=A0A975DF15_9GAMM|nr:DNA (cytosine-5-)-methyltransferase [Pseudoalteromonas xiamenensis]QTH70593.1 DNA (cytosine-5-)-methyltransferase [Pseudoalteromonas xiamenensis]